MQLKIFKRETIVDIAVGTILKANGDVKDVHALCPIICLSTDGVSYSFVHRVNDILSSRKEGDMRVMTFYGFIIPIRFARRSFARLCFCITVQSFSCFSLNKLFGK